MQPELFSGNISFFRNLLTLFIYTVNVILTLNKQELLVIKFSKNIHLTTFSFFISVITLSSAAHASAGVVDEGRDVKAIEETFRKLTPQELDQLAAKTTTEETLTALEQERETTVKLFKSLKKNT